ncbi:dynein regulatory complex subunit 2 isoform X2 [Patagioenas fasciata]|uniref:dynein regulatory complex subunit 2 isoform X2 n=1 Tax=Patagioenas fasciata TaxID=372321 RepID=UPI003A99FB5E
MPAKRHSKASVTGQDGLLLLQSQALAQEEAAKAKRELLTRFLKDKLAKEQHSSTLNLHKLNVQWQAILREAKAKELRQDVEILSQTFARVMDCKDSAIESLVTDLEEAEEQHARALRSHLHNIDRLLQLQSCRLACLEEGYSAQLSALQSEFEAERTAILEQHKRESCYLRDMALTLEQNYSESDHEATLNFQSARDDIKNKSLQEKQYCRLQLNGKTAELWEQFRQAMQSFTEATEHQKIAFEVLKEKDQKSSREIEMQEKKLQKLQDLVAATKAQIVAHLRENEEQNQHLRMEKERALRQLQELKSKLNQARAKAHGNLARLTMQSGAALRTLQQVVDKGQRILRLAEMCRKLETEEEKLLPFYPSSLAEGEQRDAQRVFEETPTEPLAQAMRDYVGLERFWQRFNKAKLEEKALEQERAALRQRNRQLRALLRQYIEGISISQGVLVEPNPLLRAQHKSCGPRDSPHAHGDLAQGHQGATRPNSLDPVPSSSGRESPAMSPAQRGTRGHHRDRDCPEVP